MQVQRSSDDSNLNGYVVPNHVHSESNGFSSIEDSLYVSNDIRYHSTLDNKENKFLSLESDSEETDQLEFVLCMSDFPNSPTKATNACNQCFDLSLDSDPELEFEEALELEWDDCDEGDDLFCSMQEEQNSVQEEQHENIAELCSDQLVYKVPEISVLSLNSLPHFDENNEINMDLPSHDGATVEVLAVSSEATPHCNVKDITTTAGILTLDQLCSNTVTTVCFTSSAENFTNEEICNPLNETNNPDLIDEQKHTKTICSLPVTHPAGDTGENVSTAAIHTTPEEAHNLPSMKNEVSLYKQFIGIAS